MEHEEIRALIEAAADGRLDEAGIEKMQSHLSTCPACRDYAQSLSILETRLRHSLQSRYPDASLEALPLAAPLANIQIRSRRDQMTRSIVRTASWIAVAALFIFAISWAIRNTAPRQPLTGGETVAPGVTHTPAATSIPSAAAPTGIASPAPVDGSTSAMFPNARFMLPAQLPESPDSVTLYAQDYPQTASPENIAQAATPFITGGILSQSPGEGADPVYHVSDGFKLLTFAYNSPELVNYFDFTRTTDFPASQGEPPISFDRAVEIVTAFFSNLGLLPDQFRGEPAFGVNTGVHLVRLLDGHPLVYGIGISPSLVDLEAFVAPDGRVEEAHVANRTFRPLLEIPIRSAADAWQVFLNKSTPTGYRYVINSPEGLKDYRIWQRSYPTGERIDLYGYSWVLPPLNPSDPVVSFFSDWPVAGEQAANFAAQASPYDFLHAWGKLQPDGQGRLAFHIEGWEVSPYEDLLPVGTIERQGEQTFFATDQGRFQLAEAPTGLEDGMSANARGVSPDGLIFDWSYIDNNQFPDSGFGMLDACAGGGGGGSEGALGGGYFRGLRPQGGSQPVELTPTPFIPPSPFQQGQAVEATEGFIMGNEHIYTDGTQGLEVFLRGDQWDNYGGFGQYWQARLESSQIEALSQLNNLPVRIWGQVSGVDANGNPVIQVERFEEVYPGLRIQAWLGTWQLITLEGKEVLLLTAQDDKQYVLSGSIDFGKDAAIGREGNAIIIEGLAEPGKTFGGYPVITEMGGTIAQGLSDLSTYEITSDRLGIWDDRNAQAESDTAAALQGTGTVTKVELAYAAATLQQCGGIVERVNDPAQAPWLYVQPIWRFTGSFEDGRPFEVQVQALPDEYLSQQ
jgi:anti-sigma factor RsiW